MKEINILLVSRLVPCRQKIKDYLIALGYNIHFVDTKEECLEILRNKPIDITLIHKEENNKEGLTITRAIKATEIDTEIIILSAKLNQDDLLEGIHLGVADFLPLPHDPKTVIDSIEKTIKNRKLAWQLRISSECDPKDDISYTFKGQSRRTRHVHMLARQIAQSSCNSVLITGESGTGKEVIANSIHKMSNRKEKPFIAINCSAVPDELFESSFFGYNKGTFTGAKEDHPGWFELADGGTLLLDELGDMKFCMQCKLLRVLDNMVIRRLGSQKERKVNVRIIAATNQDLTKLVSEGKFRADLYHRLTHFHISLPPLRERMEDIPILLDHFIKTFSFDRETKITRFETEIPAQLMEYDFPGNVRELKNMVERAMINCNSNVLKWKHFQPLKKQKKKSKDNAIEISSYDLNTIEEEVIRQALDNYQWNKSKAASALNITRQALDRRILKHHIYAPQHK